ncbi:SDR family NAD(P)-dependent oxidoreductase [Flavobacteriaceae bacterium M23B6Z8]
MNNKGIAIVGLDCRYPGANSSQEYWENILSLRQQFRRMPDKRLNLKYYFSENTSHIDYTYSTKASVLNGYHFDRVKYKVSKSTFEQTDMAHWLALEVAYGALKDAGFENGEGLDRKRTGVILGNSLNGEFTRANIMRLRWPYVCKVLESTLSNMNYSNEEIAKILSSTERVYKEPFPKPTADTLAGGLSNTIAGRICNYFDFNGGGFTVDGACSSSLLAFVNGCNAIINDELDVALVGGIDLSIDPFEVIGFARNGALAAKEMEVYSTKSSGFWPGEGCGVVVLMKEEEAVEKGLNIYGVIKGWGVSSDGNGGITRPKPETQQMAFSRAYKKAGYDISTVALFEGHGTGTSLGDKVELTAITNSLKENNKKGDPAIIGSVKHLIGHTKAAAGVAGLIKVCLALKSRILPASRKPIGLHPVLESHKDMLAITHKPLSYEGEIPMRAAVSSMGFGGINVHLTLEESVVRNKPSRINKKVKQLADNQRDTELFPLSASSKDVLLKTVFRLKEIARDISRAELIDLSCNLTSTFRKNGKWNASIVASNPDELLDRLTILEDIIKEDKPRFIDVNNGVFFDSKGTCKKIVYLFPGQGAPIYTDLGAYKNLYTDLFGDVAQYSFEGNVADTSIAQPAIVSRSLQSVALLDCLGVNGDTAIGHSLGEISALAWAGAFNASDAEKIAKERGAAMSVFGKPYGAMLALACDLKTVKSLIYNYNVCITGYNGPNSHVIGGLENEIDAVQALALEKGIQNVRLKVSHAFHTPLMNEAASEFKKRLKSFEFSTVQKPVLSTVFGRKISGKANLQDHLYRQIEQPVLFTQALEKAVETSDLFIELGPGQTLSKSLAAQEELECVALDFGSSSLKGLLNTLSIAHVSGTEIAFSELNVNRFYRCFDVENWKLDVLENPCEKIDYESAIVKNLMEASPSESKAVKETKIEDSPISADTVEGVATQIKKLISDKTELPLEAISLNDHIMSQLHLNSLSITEIVSLATKKFNKSHKVFSAASIKANSDGTIQELSEIIFHGESGGNTASQKENVDFSLLPNWTHTFIRNAHPAELPKMKVDHGAGLVRVIGNTGLEKDLEEFLQKRSLKAGAGTLFLYESSKSVETLEDFVAVLNSEEVKQGRFFVLVEIDNANANGDLKPVLRSFQLEHPEILTTSIQLPGSLQQSFSVIADEVSVLNTYKEVIYDDLGARAESQFDRYTPKTCDQVSLSTQDVIIATGGGKGITFESAKELAGTYGCRLALFGRSTPEKDTVLARNLALLDREEIVFKYYSVDVTNKQAIKTAVTEVIKELGEISVLLHGAGVNNPKRLELLTTEDFEKTQRVKVKGLRNILDALQQDTLRYLIGYGSIIAESGMQGNADYAWANDQLARLVDTTSASFSNCKGITIEWSVWDETGMGVTLNSIDTLKKQHVWPIPIENGLHILKALINDPDHQEKRIVVSGRFGTIPTLKYRKEKLKIARFVSKIRYLVPGVEIISDVPVNLNDDIYLKNHVFQGQYVFPTVMILEGMAQLAQTLQPAAESQYTFENLEIHHSIFIPESKSNIIRFAVTRTGNNTFTAVVQSEDSGFEVNCFEAIIRFEEAIEEVKDLVSATKLPDLPFEIESKFYDDLLFHHGPFRRIKRFKKINALSSLAVAESSLKDNWFGSFLADALVLGDPGLNDAAIHCHQACRPGFNLLPVKAESITINTAKTTDSVFIHTTEIREEGDDTVIDVYVFDENGVVHQYWKNLVLTRVTGTSFNKEWDLHLLAPYIEYQLFQLTGNKSLSFDIQSCRELLRQAKNNQSPTIEIEGYLLGFQKNDAGISNAIEMQECSYCNPNIKISGSDHAFVISIAQLSAVTDK